MEKKTDTYLGVIIILGVLTTMVFVGLTRDPYADASGQAMMTTSGEKVSFVWTNKVNYVPGETMLIKWNVPTQYKNYLREVHLVNKDSGAYLVLAKDVELLSNNQLYTNAPNFPLKGTWYVRVTVQPYMATSAAWSSQYVTVR